MDPVTLGAIAIGGSAALNAGIGGYNLYQQHKNLEYQKWAQRRQWAREDTAVQRRKADLMAAGMSPTLAAGQGAMSSPPISTHAPQADAGSMNVFKNVIDVTQTLAQAQLTKMQADWQSQKNKEGIPALEAEQIRKQFDALQQTIKTQKAIEAKTWTEIDTMKYNKMWAQIAHVSTNASGLTQLWGTGVNVLTDAAKQIDDGIKSKKMDLRAANKIWADAIERATKQAIKEGLKPAFDPKHEGMGP